MWARGIGIVHCLALRGRLVAERGSDKRSMRSFGPTSPQLVRPCDDCWLTSDGASATPSPRASRPARFKPCCGMRWSTLLTLSLLAACANTRDAGAAATTAAGATAVTPVEPRVAKWPPQPPATRSLAANAGVLSLAPNGRSMRPRPGSLAVAAATAARITERIASPGRTATKRTPTAAWFCGFAPHCVGSTTARAMQTARRAPNVSALKEAAIRGACVMAAMTTATARLVSAAATTHRSRASAPYSTARHRSIAVRA
jgi:hypothetical protein